ncbi:hypothetical protein HOY34_02935 [Xinfangfangia sp. D13-10-4-6]|uniref:hypothetical protein n=1 Tax=Pseudogemmobacter hezensis TaxID=2737662 RepID=UPI0015562FA0|nr:hypothetical protein [Pseudogemmobacter hezensis]NPD14151.1 hypothetical protein [Pseudogemmobacter hezensis]
MTRRLLRVVAVLGVALGAGYLVQNMQKNQTAHGASSARLQAIGSIEQVAARTDPGIQTYGDRSAELTLAPSPETASALAETSSTEQSAPDALAADIPLEAAGGACRPDLQVRAADRGMLDVMLTASCSAGAGVTLSHAGLTFTARLDDAGKLALSLPGFDSAGEVQALTADGFFANAAAPLADLNSIRRLAVQWIADDAFQLRATENTSEFGSDDDVSAASPLSPAGGSLLHLGDSSLDVPMLAEIYTWPQDEAVASLPVVEAAVTDTTCGRRIHGELLRLENGRRSLENLSFNMPGCDATGDIMVLNNLVPDKTLVAAN